MKRFFLLIFLLILDSAEAWNWDTHRSLVDAVYYALDSKQTLNLSLMEEGSIAPDKYFKDYVRHSYPKSYKQAEKWLAMAEDTYKTKDYGRASYAFGVASHYISDSFVAPHYISGESDKLHSLFEKQAEHKVSAKCRHYRYDLNESLYKASENKMDWEIWLDNKDSSIPERETEESLALLYAVALDLFKAECKTGKTTFYKTRFVITPNIIIFFSIVIAAICIYLIIT